MCVIAIIPEAKQIDLETVLAMHRKNPHGAGIAWRTKDHRVRWIKTDDPEHAYRLACEKPGERILHFRVASVGPICDELRHPFPVARKTWLGDQGKSRAVLFENGTWPKWQNFLSQAEAEGYQVPEGPMSDARAAAFLCSIRGHRWLERTAGPRWVYFSAKRTSIYGRWFKLNGIKYSNKAWLPRAALPSRNRRKAPEVQTTLWDESIASYWRKLQTR